MSIDYDAYDELLLNEPSKKKKRRELLEELEELDAQKLEEVEDAPPSGFTLSAYIPPKKPKKEDLKEEEIEERGRSWMDTIAAIGSMGSGKIGKKRKKGSYDIFSELEMSQGKRKKKKKKKDGEMVDYRKEFETEAALYRNLLQDQNKFTDSLQKEYDRLKGVKSSSRGISKTMTDLIENITQARSLSMNLVKETVNVKKTIADLTLKQKKELGSKGDEAADMGAFASTYLKQMLNERQNIIGNTGAAEIVDYDDDLVDGLLDDALDGLDVNPETEKYVQYENQNVRIWAVINRADFEDYDFVAYTEDMNVIPDYPLPTKTTLSINDSTLMATDTYGRKYPIKWR